MGALEAGQPVAVITEAVFACALSALKDERERAASLLSEPRTGGGTTWEAGHLYFSLRITTGGSVRWA